MTKFFGKMAGFVSLAAFVLAPVAVSAHTITQTNRDTGNNSTNRNRASITETHTHTTVNTATVNNVVVLGVNTGGNSSHHNTDSDGDVRSGDVSLTIKMKNKLN